LHNPLLKIRDYLFVKQLSSMIQVECLYKEFWNKLNFIHTKFISYKNEDFDRRNEFVMQRIDEGLNFLFNIVFSDEANFLGRGLEVNGNINRHNCRLWSDENPHYRYTRYYRHIQNVQKNWTFKQMS